MARATLMYLFIALYLIVMGPIAILWTILARETTFIFRAARFCIAVAGRIAGIHVRIHGREKILPGQNYVFLSNHRANLDGPLLACAAPRDMRAVVKREMMKIPILSLVLKVVNYVPIDRSDPLRARESIDRGAELLRQGFSFFAFPEGTRSRDGTLGPFKKGVFHMAIQTGTPIVPTTIINSAEIQPPGTYRIYPGTVEVIFHEPIETKSVAVEDRNLVIEATRKAISSGLPGGS
jgi:1-acyl-sn-glycerol-3-phosphate acyltransferase